MTKHAKPEPPPPRKQAKPKSQLPTGRIGFDDRGNAVWEWRTENGAFEKDVDTQRVKALQDSTGDFLSIEHEPRPTGRPTGNDPYSSAAGPRQPFRANPPRQPEKEPQRRTLDDMRRLSEEIKRQRALKKPT